MNVGAIVIWLALACCSAPIVTKASQKDPRVAVTAVQAVPVTQDGAVSRDASSSLCRSQLCGMDSYCACHVTRNGDRCWSAPDDCEVDAACCASRTGYCDGLRMDECADATVKARKARDSEKGTP